MTVDSNFHCHPTVCAVGDDYHIMLPVKTAMLVWVQIGDECFYDESNGILRSNVDIHRIIVPARALNTARGYTLIYRKIINRTPYFPKSEDEVAIAYPFKPLEKTEGINIYHVSDAHGMIDAPASAAGFFGDDLDLFLLNGDIANFSGSIDDLSTAYKIASAVTGGSIPCVFSRGNHDLRGPSAENLAEFTPNCNGKSYYTFKIGCIWGILVDCGEDKADDCIAYGHTICCEDFRTREEAFIRSVIAHADEEYNAPGVKYRLIVSHVPFTYNKDVSDELGEAPFMIEIERYTRWAKILKENIRPNLMLSGHLHINVVSMPGSPYDCKGQPCPVVIGATPDTENNTFIGAAVTLHESTARVVFNDESGVVSHDEIIPLAGR